MRPFPPLDTLQMQFLNVQSIVIVGIDAVYQFNISELGHPIYILYLYHFKWNVLYKHYTNTHIYKYL